MKLDESLHEVVTLILHGDMSEYDRSTSSANACAMKLVDWTAFRVRLRGLRSYEISIEVSEQMPREHDLAPKRWPAVGTSAVDICTRIAAQRITRPGDCALTKRR